MRKTIWYDFTNVPHVNFLLPIYQHLKDSYDSIFTIRDFAETKFLFEKEFGSNYFLVGKHKGQSKLSKISGVFERIFHFSKLVKNFDVKISVGGDSSCIYAKLKGRKSITFDDNEKAPNWRYSYFSDFAFWPAAIPTQALLKQGFKKAKLFQYDGFKEDLYIADFKPDGNFLQKIPFKKYLVVRPENIQANYVSNNLSIVPELLRLLEIHGYNVLFLPRYEHDKQYSKGSKQIYIPPVPLNGLDICYHADAVLTGAGTLAREAACLGVPAISFYAGKELLTVDQKMIENEWMFFSRSPNEIFTYLQNSTRKHPDLSRSLKVKSQILQKLDEVLDFRK